MNRLIIGSLLAAGFCIVPLTGFAGILIDTDTVEMTPADVADFYSMEARIVGEAGVVYQDTSFGEPLLWSCDACADGQYRVELRTAVTKGTIETSEGDAPDLLVAEVETADFSAYGGLLAAVQKDASVLKGVALAILDWMIPSAEAQDLLASSGVPAIDFDDTTDDFFGADDFVLFCQGGVSPPGGPADRAHNCTFSDIENNRSMFSVNSTPGAVQFGIGTGNPLASLHLASPQQPRILFDSAGSDMNIGGVDDFNFVWTVNPDATGIPLTLENNLGSGLYPGVGVWEQDPSVPLQVGSITGRDAQILVENRLLSGPGDKVMFRLVNPGSNIVRFAVSANGSQWTFDNNPNFQSGATAGRDGQFRVSKVGTGVVEFSVDGFGNARSFGNSFANQHVNTSSREVKTDFAPLDEQTVLEKLVDLPIGQWRYKSEAAGQKHIGPVAEDWHAAFGLSDGKTISTVDANGVALAAIKGLHQSVRMEQRKNASLEGEVQALRNQLAEKDRQFESLTERMAILESILLRKEVAVR